MRPTLAVLALCGWLWPVALAAQEPPPTAEPTPAPTPTPAPETTPPADPDAEAVPTPTPEPTPEPEPEPGPGEISIKADVQEGDEGHYQARGFVDLQAGSFRIQCDALDLYATQSESGATDRKLVAEGNVVFMRGEERLAGSKLTMEMGSGRGLFENAVGYVQPGVFIEGDTIERLDSSTYRITAGKFSSCSQPNPRWSFRASSATVKVGDRIVGKNVVFEVKEVPAFYIPYFYYPIRKDQRSTGILFPNFGFSSVRGFNVGTGFFWAMGRSFDQTFSVDRYSRFGYGFGHEFRYARRGRSGGTFRTYAFRLDPSVQSEASGAWDYDFDWSAIQELPGGFTANISARLYSSTQFQQQFQDNLNLASSRQQRASFNVRRSFGSTRVELTADTRETIFSDSNYDEFDQLVTDESTRVTRHLPSLSVRRSPRKIGRTGIVFSYEASADRLARGDLEDLEGHTRIDVAPSLSRSFALTFLQVTPRLHLRYTRYGASFADDGSEERPVIQRRFLESGVQMRGPQFSRVFNNPGGLYSERFKHIIGPEATWSYRTRVEDFLQIPRFDRIDYFLGQEGQQTGNGRRHSW